MTVAVKALVFDVFGTVVDWRTSIIREGQLLQQRVNLAPQDWGLFANDWRAGYQPAMQDVRSGALPWTDIDGLHRRILNRLLAARDVALSEDDAVDFNRVWHRLIPWPDSVAGLYRLKQTHTITSLSNGNMALLVNMAKHAGLPWDAVLSAELFRHYKPDPEVYRGAAHMLGLQPAQVLRHVQLPYLLPGLTAVLILRSADILKLFDMVFTMTRGGPGAATDLISIYIQRVGFRIFDMGTASAQAILLLILTIVISRLFIKVFYREIDA